MSERRRKRQRVRKPPNPWLDENRLAPAFDARKAVSDEGHAPDVLARMPDPKDEATFVRAKLNWDERSIPPHAQILTLYRECLRLRAREPVPLRSRRSGSSQDASRSVS